tara:strand:- start:904 stop:1962 length:1059 start_codon:yes stop_codon:yes gene_type:complete
MARKPFFSGNYGSALARVDTRPIIEAGRAQGQMFANLGGQIGKTIEQYQLNKEKRDKAEAAFQGDMRRMMQDDPNQLESMQDDPVIGPTLKRIEEGKGTLKDFDAYNAYRAADKEALIEKMKLDTLRTQQGMLKVQAELEERLSDPKVKKAIAEANIANDQSMYAKSIASAEYAGKIQDNALKSAQTEYYEAKSKAEKNSETYKPGQRVDIEGASGNKVSFVWTGNSLQPLNDTISKKVIEEAMIQGLDQASLMAYLDENYEYDEDTESYDFKGKDNMLGFGGGQKNPMMERAITILGMRGQINDEDLPSDSSKEESTKIEPTIDEHKSANEKAKSSGKMFYIINGKKYKVQ